ncbi:hypothetical protein MIND_00631700 [Mycena indigotica]|uniref:Uncharacterized protein n=1 Tax=Mycena indigotica TaxID=2126181 RepID=A0A8H6SS20_9AGAR|nr:uncharacterized protein MIND_00631700 [Mycena indigotica]KAF7304005.1 hypothetical protein MIND_00631700 [Mycena indigotica]
MPVTFNVASHHAESVPLGDAATGLSPRQILEKACAPQYKTAGDLRGTSFSEPDLLPKTPAARVVNVIPQPNGFFHTIATAYNRHHALVLRPDDVWLAIVTQFNFFVNANAELLRANFVAHDGQKNLEVESDSFADFGVFARAMAGLIEKNVVDPELRKWAIPDFTTTTELDVTVSSIVLMATLKAYFTYTFSAIACGIPQVTLKGEKADWEKLLIRAEKLKEYGLHTIAWYHLLVPVLRRFVLTFDDPSEHGNIQFWQQVAHFWPGGSGPSVYSGWLNAFCVFDQKGRWIGPKFKRNVESAVPPETLTPREFWETYTNYDPEWVLFDDTGYHTVEANYIPPCYAEVDVMLLDNGVPMKASMCAGIIGMRVDSSGSKEVSMTGENDVVKPQAGWWLFDKLE